MPLKRLTLDEVKIWIEDFDPESNLDIDELFAQIGGHPLALEFLELYGTKIHGDWLKFLRSRDSRKATEMERNLLSTLAVSEKPVVWEKLAKAVSWNGNPPENLLSHGLIIELEDGMWLHEALRERLLREVGAKKEERRESLI